MQSALQDDNTSSSILIRVLIIENLAAFAENLRSQLRSARGITFDVLWVESFVEGVNLIASKPFELVMIDLSLPDGAGLSNVQQIRLCASHLPIIVLSGIDDERIALEAVHEGAQDYLVRDRLDPQLLARSIRYAIERQNAENALQDAEEKYRGFFEHIVEGIFQTSPDGRYLSANTALTRIYGYDNASQLIDSIKDIGSSLYVNPHRREEFVRTMEEHDVVTGFESEIYRRDGTTIWISENVRAIRSKDGTLLCYEGTVEDITQRRKIAQELKDSEALYHSLVETLPQNIFRKDLEGRFTFCNQRFCQTIGIPFEQIRGKTDHELFPRELADKYHRDDLHVLETRCTYETVERNQTPGGAVRHVQVVKTPLVDGRGQVVGLQGIFWDITEKREAEEREQRANAELARGREELRIRNSQMEQDIRMAREIQQAILPQQYPSFPRGTQAENSAVHFHHRYSPSGDVGGDYFTILPISSTKVGLFICDVMGHGVRSALVTAMIRALVEELTPRAGDPGDLLTRLNHDLRAILRQTGSPMYATAFYLVADLSTGQAEFANAGHPRQLLLNRPSGEITYLPHSKALKKPPLGLMNATTYKTATTCFGPGSRFLLFTDGLIEVEGADQQFLGLEALAAAAAKHCDQPLAGLFDKLIEGIRSFSHTGTFDDDLCMVGMDVTALVPGEISAEMLGL